MAEREQEGDLKQFIRRETMVNDKSMFMNFNTFNKHNSTASKVELDRILNTSNIGLQDNPSEAGEEEGVRSERKEKGVIG